jgi:hypothetical protein
MMMSVRLVNSSTALPYGALITRIVQNAKAVTKGMIELAPKKGPITSCYLNVSNAHLQEPTQEPRPQRWRVARADGAFTSASQDEQLDRMEASLQTYEQTLQLLALTVQEDHNIMT